MAMLNQAARYSGGKTESWIKESHFNKVSTEEQCAKIGGKDR